jgi:SagB-type dehydrogenase family enzyme
VTPNNANRDLSRAHMYHDATKHSEWSIRSNRHYMDWANQPLPLKIYTTLDPIPLPRDADQTGISALSAIAATDIPGDNERVPTLADLARILYLSAGITRKRTYPGGEIYYRAASCTGALYAFELYLVCGDLPDLKAGVYHFGPGDFALRLLRSGDYRGTLSGATAAENSVLHAPVSIVCAGTFWRNSWKYQARTYRHFGWDNGTMLANMLAITAALQLPRRIVLGFVDHELNELLGLDEKREVAFSIMTIGRVHATPANPPEIPVLELPTIPLSQREVAYPEINEIHAASSLESAEQVSQWRQRMLEILRTDTEGPAPQDLLSNDPIEQVILRRGSTRKFTRQPITREELSTILYASMQPIWPDFPLQNDVYLVVNAVEGMTPGAYFYDTKHGTLDCLREGEFRGEARHLALQQDLAGDAAVNVFFLSNLDLILERLGNRGYRAVQLEAGILGGKVYLASYALQLGATGLTFFDDDVIKFFSPHAKDMSAIFLVAVGKSARFGSPLAR